MSLIIFFDERKTEKEERNCGGSYQNRKIRKTFNKHVSFEGRFENLV